MAKTMEEQSRDQVQPLEGWITIPEAAERLGCTRANVHKMVKSGKFPQEDLAKAGPVVMIKTTAVDREVNRRTTLVSPSENSTLSSD